MCRLMIRRLRVSWLVIAPHPYVVPDDTRMHVGRQSGSCKRLVNKNRAGLTMTRGLLPRRHWTLVDNHPVNAEPILHLPKAGGEERFLYRHQGLTAIGKRSENSFSLVVAVHA